MARLTARHRRAIERRIATAFARDRLARALFEIVADGLDLGPVALRSAADRAWVQVAIAGPIQRAADDALGCLASRLDHAVSGCRPDLVERLLGERAAAGADGAASAADRILAGAAARPAILRIGAREVVVIAQTTRRLPSLSR